MKGDAGLKQAVAPPRLEEEIRMAAPEAHAVHVAGRDEGASAHRSTPAVSRDFR